MENEYQESPLAKFFIIPQRVILAFMAFFAIFSGYTMRVTLSLAITHLVEKKPESKSDKGEAMCPADDDFYVTESGSGGEYKWSEHLQGIILSSFYLGYFLTHIPGGLWADKLGGKWVLFAGIASSAIATALSPASIIYGGPYALVGMRILMGLGQGVIFPALSVLLSDWVPLSERGKLGSLVLGGGQMGSIVGNTISGFLLAKYHWSVMFYFFAIMSGVWCILFAILCYNGPTQHPFIKKRERDFLYVELVAIERKDVPPTPWKAIFTNAPVIAMIIAQIGHDWGLFVMVTDLPKYMSDVMRFSIKKNGVYSSLPYLLMWLVSVSSGFVADALIKYNILSVTNTRKLLTSIAAFGPGFFVVLASYFGCNRVAVVISFILAMGTMGTFFAGVKLSPMDLSPNYSGTLMAIANGIGALTGVIAPYLVGVMTPNSTMMEWRMVFWLAFAVLSVTTIIYCIWASAEIQPFDSPDQKPRRSD